jgi:acyl-CoA reductase-like NAD-dependent aldehyde dehydrogenase
MKRDEWPVRRAARARSGGFKQSGRGRELGSFGLEGYVEPEAVVGAA